MSESLIQIFKSKDGHTEIQVKLEKDTVWLTQKQISDLFEKDKDTIGLHFKNIFNSGELDELKTDYTIGNALVDRKYRGRKFIGDTKVEILVQVKPPTDITKSRKPKRSSVAELGLNPSSDI